MLFDEIAAGNKSIGNILQELDDDDIIKSPYLLNITESLRLEKNILKLNEVIDYMKSNNKTIDDVIKEVSSIYDINPNSIAFSCYPIDLYQDYYTQIIAAELNENYVPIYMMNDTLSETSQVINQLVDLCDKINSEEPIDMITEGFFDGIKRAANSNITTTIGTQTKNIVGGFGRSVENAAKKTGSKIIDDKVFGNKGYLKLDQEVTDKDGRKRIVRNARVANNVRDFAKNTLKLGDNMTQGAVDFSKFLTDEIRENAPKEIVEKASNLLKKPFNRANYENMVNSIDAKTQQIRNNMNSDPQKRGIFARILDALNRLKNKILEILHLRSKQQ